MSDPGSSIGRWDEVLRLRHVRPRSKLVRLTVAVLGLLGAYAWLSGDISVGDLLSPRRRANLERFIEQDATPYPIREEGFSWNVLGEWAGDILSDHGWSATLATLWISVLAITLAGAVACVLAPLGTRTLFTCDPYLLDSDTKKRSLCLSWRITCGAVRGLFILMRAIPEYVWAFLLLAMLGPNAWPVVIALALHNAGILGRLMSDTLENVDKAPLRSLRMLGADRSQLAWVALRPLGLARFLLYFFYRFETCVREATVLGMLGVVSLGYWIQDARGRQLYDELLLLVALGAGLVLVGDLMSYVARGWIRRAA
ncbi:MAG: ABC transporter permease subunit [Planctomycetota bacterium]|nr:ABC transporter permease subunit [Planctomycetota bacterium]